MTKSRKRAKVDARGAEDPLILGEEQAAAANDQAIEAPVANDDDFADTNNAPDAPDATNEAELLAEQAARIAELEDQNLRMVAEVENLRRRFERERADLARYAVMPLAKEILPGIDNLERAIMAGNTPQSQDAQAFENFATGVKMTLDMLMENMTRCHIERVGAIGEVFDPNLHQVISEAPADEAHAAGTIAQIMQYGYRLHDRLIRPAMVIIAK